MYDVRDTLITAIKDGSDIIGGRTVYYLNAGSVKVYLVKDDDLKSDIPFPLIVFTVLSTTSTNQNFGSRARRYEQFIDLNLFVSLNDSYSPSATIKQITDTVESKIRANEKTLTDTMYCEVIGSRDVSELEISDVKHWLIEVRAISNVITY